MNSRPHLHCQKPKEKHYNKFIKQNFEITLDFNLIQIKFPESCPFNGK